jgi:hypothetical protein
MNFSEIFSYAALLLILTGTIVPLFIFMLKSGNELKKLKNKKKSSVTRREDELVHF